jgi:hypothetical protein
VSKGVILAYQKACVILIALIVIVVNTVNWLAHVNDWYDRELQWQVSMLMIAFSSFLMAAYIWIGESLNKRKYGIIISGWVALYLLVDLIGVVLGYNLHTKGLMIILLMTFIFGTAHLTIRLWQK